MSEPPRLARPRAATVHLRQEVTEYLGAGPELQQRPQASESVDALIATAAAVIGDAHRNGILLLALALDSQRAEPEVFWQSTGSLIASLRRQVPRFRVLEVMVDLDDLVDDAGRFHECAELATRFLDAIAPRAVASLLHQPKQLRERVRWFFSMKDQLDSEILVRAEGQLQDRFGCDESEARALVSRLSVERLRTVPPELLEIIASNDRQWRPLIEVLTGARTTSVELDAELQRLLGQLRAVVRSQWWTSDRGIVEDAVQDAFTAAIESLSDPRRGYSYEGDFLAWLASVALNRLRSQSRRPSDEPVPVTLQSEPLHHRFTDAGTLLEEWRARYLLAETFFKGGSIQRVKAIFEWMLLQAMEDDDEMDDDRLAGYIEDRTGDKVNKDTLAGTRRRLRQRLEALRYVRDLVPLGATDSPGDADLLAHITGKFGLAEPDIPTIRGLGGLARACPSPRSLHWARWARLITEKEEPATDVGQEAQSQSPLPFAASQRLARWLTMRRSLRELRTWANAQRVGFLLAPCWCLAVLDGRTGHEAVSRLKASSSVEASGIQRIVADLSNGISP